MVDVWLETRLRSFILSIAFVMGDELLCVVGRSGSGKSTILRAIAGVYIPDNGSISIRDRHVFSTGLGVNVPPAERYAGYVPPSHALFPHLSVRENLAYSLRKQQSLPDDEITRRELELLDLLDLSAVAENLPADISVLHQHRAALARALAGDPDVLLLDDAFAQLDTKSRRTARAEFAGLRNQLGVPAIVATTELEEAYEIADRVALIEGGRLLQIDAPRTLLLHPVNRRVAELVRSVNVFSGTILESAPEQVMVETAYGVLQATGDVVRGEAVDVVIRPEHLQILAEEPHDERPNVLQCRVSREEQHASVIEIMLVPQYASDGAALQAYLKDAARQMLTLQSGSECWLYLPPRALHLMRRPMDVTSAQQTAP